VQKKPANFHEAFRREPPAQPGSTRAFGFTVAGFSLAVGLFPAIHHAPIRTWSVLVAGFFGVVALFAPRILAPLLWLWMRLGALLHKATNMIFLGLIFYGAFVPTGAIMRLLNKRPLNLRFDPERASYWTDRVDEQSSRDMTRQF
jgi:hypothetical protein